MSLKIEETLLQQDSIAIPAAFFSQILPKVNPAYAAVYLYGYCACMMGQNGLDAGEIAKALNMLTGDVIKSLKALAKEGYLTFSGDSITFLALQEAAGSQEAFGGQERQQGESEQRLIERPEYSAAEISIYVEKNDNIRDLFASAQSHLGRLLTVKDMEILFSFYDWLGLPMEVIEILLAYCIKNDHRNIHYIESVALDWAESGVNTPQKALKRINLYTNGYMKVMKAFGQGGRYPTKTETGYLKKWINQDKIPIPLLEAACDKTVMATGKASFSYADRIIESWKKAKVKTLEDIKRLDDEYAQAQKAKRSQATERSEKKAPLEKKNRFINYEEREWNFEELERLEMERNRKNAGKV